MFGRGSKYQIIWLALLLGFTITSAGCVRKTALVDETLTGQLSVAAVEQQRESPAARATPPEAAASRMPQQQETRKEAAPGALQQQTSARAPAAAAFPTPPTAALPTPPPMAVISAPPAAIATIKEEPIREEARRPKTLNLDSVFFDFDKYNLSEQSRELLQRHATFLSKIPDFTLVIEGHCDERGTHEYNLALGERRAVEVMKYLAALGVSEKRIRTMSYGEEMPAVPGSNEDAWARNRRAEFKLTIK